ncbi:hypothetical protein BH18THE2_BH18THE2_06100 [soil metagenome]
MTTSKCKIKGIITNYGNTQGHYLITGNDTNSHSKFQADFNTFLMPAKHSMIGTLT